MKKVKTYCLAVAAAMSLSGGAFGAQGLMVGVVSEFLYQEGVYGNCMIKLKYSGAVVNPTDTLAGCASYWTSLGCAGDFHSKSFAQNLVSTAQLSLVTGNRIGVYIDDTTKYNGYCVAYRIDAVDAP